MEITNSFEYYSDKELKDLLLGKQIEVVTTNNKYIGVVTGFINAAQWDDHERKFMGIILNSESEILLFNDIKKLTIKKND